MQPKINVNSSFGVPIYEVQGEGISEHRQALIEALLEMRQQDTGTWA